MLSIRRLTKRFSVGGGRVTALKDLMLEVAEGEFFVLVGASGSGKTTLLRCVAGLENPEGGQIEIDGRTVYADAPPTWVPPQGRGLGMVFQSYAVWPHLTVYDNVALPLREGAQRVSRQEVDSRVRRALELVELGTFADRPSTLLSGGQQQRVALARAVAVSSRVVLMDEPLSNLDARLREDVRVRIRDLAKRIGATVLYVTHDQVEAMAMADRIALLRLGELLQVGRPEDLYRRPNRPEVADFFGAVNWLPGTVVAPGVVETAVGRLRVDEPTVSGQSALLGIRPECLTPVGANTGRQENVLDLRLVSSSFLGDQSISRLAAGEHLLTSKSRLVPTAEDGRVRVAVAPAEIMVFPDAKLPAEAGLAEPARFLTPEPVPAVAS